MGPVVRGRGLDAGTTPPHPVLVPDPHVQALYYRFKSLSDLDTFDKAVPLSGALGDFEFTLESAVLVAHPRAHFPDRESARDALEPYLRSWERGAFLSSSNHRIEFEYDHADIVDRDRNPHNIVLYPEPIRLRLVALDATVKRENGRYPEPDAGFATTPLTDRLAERLRRVRDAEAEVPAAAYTVLTALEANYGGGRKGTRQKAAVAMSVDLEILHTLGELTDRRDPDLGRKAGTTPVPFTAAELWWLRDAMGLLIRRTGELAAGTAIRQLSMSDLPSL
jgi:hypothetical protein